VGLSIQPCEGQERLSPVITTHHEIVTDSGGPGRYRGGCGLRKGGILTNCENTVMSYCCDRSRSVTWGILGGLPSLPHGAWLNPGTADEKFLGTVFSNIPLKPGDSFDRPSAGGGGLGDPLQRDPHAVLEDVIDQYVSIERARKDYGVVIKENDWEVYDYEIDWEATETERAYIRAHRKEWLWEDIASVAQKFRAGEIDELDLIRRYGVIMDYTSGEILPTSTEQYREMLYKRTLAYWS
jgi:N-methylhydantoinase B